MEREKVEKSKYTGSIDKNILGKYIFTSSSLYLHTGWWPGPGLEPLKSRKLHRIKHDPVVQSNIDAGQMVGFPPPYRRTTERKRCARNFT